MKTSRGSRPTKMYFASVKNGSPSSGKCDFSTRRRVHASISSITSARGLRRTSIHGENSSISRTLRSWKIRWRTIACIQVVPALYGVATMTSSWRGRYPRHRVLSMVWFWYILVTVGTACAMT